MCGRPRRGAARSARRKANAQLRTGARIAAAGDPGAGRRARQHVRHRRERGAGGRLHGGRAGRAQRPQRARGRRRGAQLRRAMERDQGGARGLPGRGSPLRRARERGRGRSGGRLRAPPHRDRRHAGRRSRRQPRQAHRGGLPAAPLHAHPRLLRGPGSRARRRRPRLGDRRVPGARTPHSRDRRVAGGRRRARLAPRPRRTDDDIDTLPEALAGDLVAGDLCVLMGAGSIEHAAPRVLGLLEAREAARGLSA